MDERTWWSTHAKGKWNSRQKGWLAWKVEDKYFGGLSDVLFCFNGVSGLMEMKYISAWQNQASKVYTFSKEKNTGAKGIVKIQQERRLDEWTKSGGLAFVGIIVGQEFYLLHWFDVLNKGMTRTGIEESSSITLDTYQDLGIVPAYIEAKYGK